ncbi:EamA family transporter [Candidatus Woesearchaeota archaeon]|nr:EamA family transporter [Candidatus Woesearchaeota archaeon]
MQQWLIFALFTALLTGIVAIIDKKILLKEHAMEFSAIFSLTNAVLALFLMPFVNFNIGIKNIILIYIISWFSTLGFLFATKAIRHMELSSAIPLMNLNPVLIAVLGIIFLGEFLTVKQWSGIVLVLFGGYILETRHLTNYKEFFYNLRKSKAIKYIFLSMLFYSFSSIADRFIVTKVTNVTTYLFFVLLFIAFNFFLMSSILYGGIKDIKKSFRKHWKLIAITGVLTFGYRLSQIYAVSLANVGLVINIKRLSVLFAVFFGGELFHENNLTRKIIATIVMLMGTVLIAI